MGCKQRGQSCTRDWDIVIRGRTKGSGDTVIRGRTKGSGDIAIRGRTKGSGDTVIRGRTKESGDTVIRGGTKESGDIVIRGRTKVSGGIVIRGKTKGSALAQKPCRTKHYTASSHHSEWWSATRVKLSSLGANTEKVFGKYHERETRFHSGDNIGTREELKHKDRQSDIRRQKQLLNRGIRRTKSAVAWMIVNLVWMRWVWCENGVILVWLRWSWYINLVCLWWVWC